MIRFAFLLALVLVSAVPGARAQEREIQRALVERDQQSAAFAAGVPPELNARQLRDVMTIPIAPELRPYQRQRMAEDRQVFALPPPQPRNSLLEKPLPLPGRPGSGVDPVLPQGFPG